MRVWNDSLEAWVLSVWAVKVDGMEGGSWAREGVLAGEIKGGGVGGRGMVKVGVMVIFSGEMSERESAGERGGRLVVFEAVARLLLWLKFGMLVSIGLSVAIASAR